MLKMTALAVLLLACACHAQGASGDAPSPEPLRPAGAEPTAAAAPGPGALAFGSAEARAIAALGKPTASWEREGFQWRRWDVAGTTVEVGFYRDKLGRFSLKPAAPLGWDQALAWARAFAPGLDEARLDRTKAEAWQYFEQIEVDKVPFEAGITFAREGDRVSALRGEMNWLD